MAILHTVNKSPFEKSSLDTCMRLSLNGSAILLLEDGVYAALVGTEIEINVSTCLKDRKVYVLMPDLVARGLGESELIRGIESITYTGFVNLVAAYEKVQSWH